MNTKGHTDVWKRTRPELGPLPLYIKYTECTSLEKPQRASQALSLSLAGCGRAGLAAWGLTRVSRTRGRGFGRARRRGTRSPSPPPLRCAASPLGLLTSHRRKRTTAPLPPRLALKKVDKTHTRALERCRRPSKPPSRSWRPRPSRPETRHLGAPKKTCTFLQRTTWRTSCSG